MHRVTREKTRITPAQRAAYQHEMDKARLGNNIANHMAYIYMMVLYDKMDFSMKQIFNFSDRTMKVRQEWQNDDNKNITSESLLKYSIKKKIDAVGFVKSVPLSQRMFLSDIKSGKVAVGAEKNINHAFLSTILLVLPVMKENYRMSNAKIEEFLKWVAYYCDSYWRRQPGRKEHYCDDETIRQAFIEDEGYDLKLGKKVERTK